MENLTFRLDVQITCVEDHSALAEAVLALACGAMPTTPRPVRPTAPNNGILKFTVDVEAVNGAEAICHVLKVLQQVADRLRVTFDLQLGGQISSSEGRKVAADVI